MKAQELDEPSNESKIRDIKNGRGEMDSSGISQQIQKELKPNKIVNKGNSVFSN